LCFKDVNYFKLFAVACPVVWFGVAVELY